jgi:arylsulfatase A-like enzyme
VGLRHALRLVQAERLALGGINQNMVVSWPARIKDKGALREQFVHVIDVVPTILEAAGIKAPEMVDGIKQAPIEGTSFAYTFDPANAKAPSRHKTQYFEMMGQWALYDDGWLLSTKVNRAPWQAFGAANPDPLNNQVFQLYNLGKDFNQTNDIAAQNPQKVKECGRSSSLRRRSTRSCRWMRRWRPASSRRARTSPPGARSSSTRDRWSACRRATRRSC